MNPDTIRVIERYSRAGYAEGVSIVDALVKDRWCDLEDLTAAYIHLQELDVPASAVFFQLPFVVRLPVEWIPIERGTLPIVRFRVIGVGPNNLMPHAGFAIGEREARAELEPMTNARLRNDPDGLLVRTQAVMLLQPEGIRREYYEQYLKAVERGRFDRILVDEGHSWVHHRALTVHTYEDDLVRHLERRTRETLQGFLPVYAVACLDPNALLVEWHKVQWLGSSFCMMKGGRIVTGPLGHSMPGLLAGPLPDYDYTERLLTLKAALPVSGAVSQYERALLDALRLAEQDAPHLAVVNAAMILEWFASLQIKHRLAPTLPNAQAVPRVSLYRRYAELLPRIGVQLPPPLLEDLRALIRTRNGIVHEEPRPTAITPHEAFRAVHTAMTVIRTCMAALRIRGQ